MDAIELREWIEELILAREIARHEEATVSMENRRLRRDIEAKDAEIARLTALLEPTIVRVTQIDRNKEAEAVKIVQDTVDALASNPLANLPYIVQEQADEHPAKSGWVETSGPDHEWKWAHRSEANGAWRRAGPLWDICAPTIIAAYDRHIQKGGQAQ